MWIRVVFFFIQTATYRIDWISRDEKKDGINLGDVKFFENKILMNYLGNYIEWKNKLDIATILFYNLHIFLVVLIFLETDWKICIKKFN